MAVALITLTSFAAAVTQTYAAFNGAGLHHAKHHQQEQNFLGILGKHIAEPAAPAVQGNVSKGHKSLVVPHDHHVNPDLVCGQTAKVTSKTDKYEDCPASCPFFAQDRTDSSHCTFACVRGEECGMYNPNKPIPDTIRKSSTCRGPVVEFCKEPNLDGSDTCRVCQSGFKLFKGYGEGESHESHFTIGFCYFEYWNLIIACTVVVAIVVLILVAWMVDLCCRETINGEQVILAQKYRSRAKIHMHKEDMAPGEHRHVWPFFTNLCTKDVAGPGMMLHFNFQAFIIVWPLIVALLWTILGCFHNELFVLGTKKFGTPRHNCILVAWGYETQQGLMWTKVLFIFLVYVITCIMCVVLAVWQNRVMIQADAKEKTMKDFAAELKGLPAIKGSDANLEKDLAAAVKHATGGQVVGVSVAWNFSKSQDEITKAVKDDQADREAQRKNSTLADDDVDHSESLSGIRKMMYKAESYLLADGPDEEAEDTPALLKELESTDTAFVVFNSEDERNAAVQILKENGLLFTDTSGQECTLTLKVPFAEPSAVNWHNFDGSDTMHQIGRLFWGFGTVYVPALLIWLVVFYLPYAWSINNFNYANGAEPPGYFAILFTMVVVGGNAIMYLVCDICSDVIGFKFKDSKQTCYMLLYLFACMFNVFLDMIITYKMALKIVIGQDFRTYDGTRIENVEGFTNIFETYGMQRLIGENAYRYAWPSTFLVPFVLEPIVTVLVPYQLGKLVIRTHKDIKGTTAEAYLAAFDFDLGRYADILLNVFLGILIFFFPGGYTWTLFYGMFISHIVIYLFDHWRVLNVIPAVRIVSNQVDWWAQIMLGACCSMILSSLVFKANCESYSGYCYKDMSLILACSVAAAVHFVGHVLILIYVVPLMTKALPDEHAGMNFDAIARNEPNSWFSTNPVHCLRSKYLHNDAPHCIYVSPGKEHLLQVNESIGCYFEDVAADEEDYSVDDAASALRKTVTDLVSPTK